MAKYILGIPTRDFWNMYEEPLKRSIPELYGDNQEQERREFCSWGQKAFQGALGWTLCTLHEVPETLRAELGTDFLLGLDCPWCMLPIPALQTPVTEIDSTDVTFLRAIDYVSKELGHSTEQLILYSFPVVS